MRSYMKKLLSLCILFSLGAFAIDPHEGGGGNVCRTQFSGDRLIALDEAYVPLVNMKTNLHFKKGHSPLAIEIFENTSQVQQTNLVKTRAGEEVQKLLARVYKFDRDFGYELQNLFLTLSHVYMVDAPFRGAYGVDPDEKQVCLKGTLQSVVITNEFGRTVVSKDNWNSLNFETQQIILIHETIRLAQMTRPWLMFQLDQHIYRLTMSIYKSDFRSLKNEAGYIDFKNFHQGISAAYSKEYFDVLVKNLFYTDFPYMDTFEIADFLDYLNPGKYTAAVEILKLKKNPRYIKSLRDLNTLDRL